MARPQHINPMQWNEAIGLARQTCARVFRNGGSPVDAFVAIGFVNTDTVCSSDWSKAVETIAQALCAGPGLRAAA